MTTLANMNNWKSSQFYENYQGESFQIDITLFENPDNYDYWMGTFSVSNPNYGNVNFVCYMFKEKIDKFDYAKSIILSGPLDRVKLIIDNSNGKEFPRNMYTDEVVGWSLF